MVFCTRRYLGQPLKNQSSLMLNLHGAEPRQDVWTLDDDDILYLASATFVGWGCFDTLIAATIGKRFGKLGDTL